MKSRSKQTISRITILSLIGLVVGMVSAMATVGFVELVSYFNHILFVSSAARSTLGGADLAWITISVLTIGGLVVGLILQYGVDGGKPLGPSDAIYAVQLNEKLPGPLSGVSSTIAAMISLGCGASVGQYGPLVYLGTLVGQLTTRLHLEIRDFRSIALACGVAAAISTAFNAPLAALIFTHEVIFRHYSLRLFTAVTVASACGYLVANVFFDFPPLLLIEFNSVFHGPEFLLFALEGAGCGIIAVIFLKLLRLASEVSAKINLPPFSKPMLAGFMVSLIAIQVPEVLGAGQEAFRLVSVPGSYDASTLLLFLSAKLLVTVICIGFGFAGTIISPALLIGLTFGALFAITVPELLLHQYSGLSVYAIAGMVAVMSPVIGAPMTAVLLVFEITRNYEVTIAAMLAIVFSNLVSFQWYGRSIYDAQLAARGMDLSLGRERAYLMHHKVVEFITQPIPAVDEESTISSLLGLMNSTKTASAVVLGSEGQYLGMVFQYQLNTDDRHKKVKTLDYQNAIEFNVQTSLWEAMEAMRGYVGEAIPVVESDSRRYLGSIAESAVISAYLDSTHELRRQEHEV